MRNNTLLKRRGVAAVISLGFFMAAAIVAQQAALQAQSEQTQSNQDQSSQAQSNQAQPAATQAADPNSAAGQTVMPAQASVADAPAPRAPEAPLETSGQQPTLDYEPTESISEDKSVSFPVDI